MPAQGDLTKSQDGGDFVSFVLSPDYKALLAEIEHGKANIEFVTSHCVAGAPPPRSSELPSKP